MSKDKDLPVSRAAESGSAKLLGGGSGATMTLNLSAREMGIVETMAAEHELSKTALIRQALRVYQVIQTRLKAGETLSFSGDPGRVLMMIGPGFDPLRAQPPTPKAPGDETLEGAK